jgi:shikimate dehydrogenase
VRKAFVVGHPIAHSRSPLIHGHWLARSGIEGAYERRDVPPAGLAAFLRGAAAEGYVGGNVTIPHKEAAFGLVDAASDRGRRLGAVNTLWFEEERLIGDNTDVLGFTASLDAAAPGWSERVRTALILGAGGAAKAVAAGLLDRGVARLLVANRTAARADEVAGLDARIASLPWPELPAHLGRADLLVNATSLGMKGHPPLSLSLDGLPGHAVVADIVYVPLETPLLAAARARGLTAVDGLGMLLHQAVPGFARWFGVTPEVTPELRALVEADLGVR